MNLGLTDFSTWPGAIYKNIYEKDIALKISLYLRDYLVKNDASFYNKLVSDKARRILENVNSFDQSF